MKVLNLYAGIGGNSMRWQDYDVTAVEINPRVAEVYQELHPSHTVVVGDAHQYLLEHYREFDIIWSSPPCQSHSKMQKATRHDIPRYPDMKLYQEIIFLTHFFNGKWVVENVMPYYDILLPAVSIGRHVFWANFPVRAREIHTPPNFINGTNVEASEALKEWLGMPYEGNIYLDAHCPAQVLRNCVHPELGLQVFKCAEYYHGQVDLFGEQF